LGASALAPRPNESKIIIMALFMLLSLSLCIYRLATHNWV
jgi:hypothetical protein